MKTPGMPSAVQRQSKGAEAILDVAERLAQTRGFNGFSYADIAAELRVTKAGLHYHFASKAELGRALIARYRAGFEQALTRIGAGPGDAPAKLKRYVGLYDEVMLNDRMCLCGMLAAEYETLPQPMRLELRAFFDANEQWLATLLREGRRAGTLAFREPVKERARQLSGALEGAMLVARIYADVDRFRSSAQQAVRDVTAAR
jgi:TetR/AcrR family transcriptional regulator, transcriptional repressor for nem operon